MPRRPHSDKDMIGVVNRVTAGGTVEKEREIYGCTAEHVARWKNEFANKFALNNRSRRPVFQEPLYRIFSLAEKLGLSFDSLLYFISAGYLPVFFVPPYMSGAIYVSVHKAFLSTGDKKNPPLAIAGLPKFPTVGISKLTAPKTEGFFLSQEDCRVLLSGKVLRQSLFPAAVGRIDDQYYLETARTSYFPPHLYPDLEELGWHVACYPDHTSFMLDPDTGYPPPIEMIVRLGSLCALTEHIEAFLQMIDSDAFLHDLIEPEAKTQVPDRQRHIIVVKPPHISAKLRHLVETSERFWCRKPGAMVKVTDVAVEVERALPEGSSDYTQERKNVSDALSNQFFCSHFAKGIPSALMLEAANRFIEPLYARNNLSDDAKLTGHSYLAPELLILLAASKLFWSPPHVALDNAASHPKKSDIEGYLRVRGITGNDADYAVTLIRPEQASYASDKSFISLREKMYPSRLKRPFS